MMSSGEKKFETAKCVLSFRKSDSVAITGHELFMSFASTHREYLRFKEPEIDRTAVKNALKEGLEIPGVQIDVKQNLQIK